MPKRKRSDRPGYGYQAREHDPDDRIDRFGKKFVHGKKRLIHALKTAKRFERQKLGKRISRTKTDGRPEELTRLEQELEALKTLYLPVAAEDHLHKTILKSKDIATSPGVQDHLSRTVPALEPVPSDVSTAEKNVVARLYNYKHLKSELLDILDSIRNALGIEVVDHVSGGSDGEIVPPTHSEEDIANGDQLKAQGPAELLADWEGLSSSQDLAFGGAEYESTYSQSDTDGDQMSLWEAPASVKASHNPAYEVPFGFGSPSPPSSPKVRAGKRPPTTPNSTFLPSLMMSGYWSGSESGQDDIEENQVRKNRRGQRARRQIWEKKYGRNANHVRNQAKEDWDPRKGAIGHKKSGIDGKRHLDSRAPLHKNEHQKVRHDGDPAPSRNKPSSHLDKTKNLPLHPSWEAARKAKERKQSMAFQGKKMVFD